MTLRKILILLSVFILTINAQQKGNWAKYTWLQGNWENASESDSSKGSFSLSPDLGGSILIRHNHAEVLRKGSTNPEIHTDLMVIYPGSMNEPDKAIYFDNEGHVINYVVAASDSSIAFTSDRSPQGMAFRLTYFALDKNLINVLFEISREPGKFFTYLESKCKPAK